MARTRCVRLGRRTAARPDALPSEASRSPPRAATQTQWCSRRATARRPRSRWCSMARVASTDTSWLAGPGSAASAALSSPPRIWRSRASAPGDSATPWRQLRHSSAAFVQVERHQRLVLPAAHASIELGPNALGRQHLPEERRHHEPRRWQGRLRAQRAQRADQHPVQVGVRARDPASADRPPPAGPSPG